MYNSRTKPLPGATLNPLHPLSRKIRGCWLLNEGAGSLVNDISSNKNHGYLVNMNPNLQSSGWNGSKYGSGVSFDGANDYIECGTSPSLNITDKISIEVLFKSETINAYKDLYHYGYNGAAFQGMFLGLKDDGKYWCRLGNGIAYSDVSSAESYTTDYTHIVATYDGSTIKLYKNGVQDANTNTLTGPIVNDQAVHANIGRASWGGYYFDGAIYKTSLYSRAVNRQEAKQLSNCIHCMLN